MGWIDVLKEQCGLTSQRKIASKIGVSGALINQVVNGVYQSDPRRLQALVEGRLMDLTVECPVFGDLNRAQCVDYQESLNGSTTNPHRIRLRKVCPDCQFNLKREEGEQC